jgi:hypothetical protein
LRLHTIVCAGLTLALAGLSPVSATAQTAQQSRFTNAEFLRLPEREQRIWVSGAVEGIANTLLLTNTEQGRCVLIWYGDGSTKFAVFRESARAHPDYQPMTVLIALANRECRFHRSR